MTQSQLEWDSIRHDVNQSELKKSLDLTVESGVNYVGVELNTASVELLSYVSGIGKLLPEILSNIELKMGHLLIENSC